MLLQESSTYHYIDDPNCIMIDNPKYHQYAHIINLQRRHVKNLIRATENYDFSSFKAHKCEATHRMRHEKRIKFEVKAKVCC